MNISMIDLSVLALYLCGAIWLGLRMGRGKKDLEAYLLGGRDVPWWAILGSIVATETSTATFLSVPGLAFAAGGDMRFLQLSLGYLAGRTLIAVLLLPRFFAGNYFTAYEVLNQRFGGLTEMTASLIFLITRNLGDGLRLFLTALALEAVLDWPLYLCVMVIGAATIIYTVFGGMKSVVWNDCAQLLCYVAGGLVAGAVILARLPGGWDGFMAYGVSQAKFRILDFSWNWSDPYTFWAGLVGGLFLTMGTHGTDQMMVQRYLSARGEADARRALIASGLAVLVQFALFLLLGVALAGYYAQLRPDATFSRMDQVFATFIVREMPQGVGLIGLLLAAVFAAAMSTLSSSLNSSVSAVVNNFCRPAQRAGSAAPDEARLLSLSRWLTVVFGLLQIGIGIAAQQLESSVVTSALAIAGFAAGLLLGVFALGVLTRRVQQAECLAGLLAGLMILLLVQFVGPLYGIKIAWPWYSLIGSVTTFAVGWMVSVRR